MVVGGANVALTVDPKTRGLTARAGGFTIAVISRVQPPNDSDFSMWEADLETADGGPVVRSTGTTDSLAQFDEHEALHFMNHSREDEVVVRCEPR
jgi:hypothetical protein